MSRLTMLIIGAAGCIASAGCTTAGTPIVAGAVDQVGIGASAGVQDQGGNLTLGYRGAKFAIVPVQTAGGQQLSLHDGPDKEKGFSVLAVLGIDSKGGAAPSAAVDQVVAVGPAADIWALGRSGLTPAQAERARVLGLIR